MASAVSEVENQGVVEIRDPEIDVSAILRRIRQNMAVREKRPPLATMLGRARLAEQRAQVRQMFHELHARVNNYGALDTRRTGWRGRLELLLKRCLRKLVGRYIAQQQEVHAALLATLEQLARYLEAQDEVLHQRFDECDRQLRPRPRTERPSSEATGMPQTEARAA